MQDAEEDCTSEIIDDDEEEQFEDLENPLIEAKDDDQFAKMSVKKFGKTGTTTALYLEEDDENDSCINMMIDKGDDGASFKAMPGFHSKTFQKEILESDTDVGCPDEVSHIQISPADQINMKSTAIAAKTGVEKGEDAVDKIVLKESKGETAKSSYLQIECDKEEEEECDNDDT